MALTKLAGAVRQHGGFVGSGRLSWWPGAGRSVFCEQEVEVRSCPSPGHQKLAQTLFIIKKSWILSRFKGEAMQISALHEGNVSGFMAIFNSPCQTLSLGQRLFASFRHEANPGTSPGLRNLIPLQHQVQAEGPGSHRPSRLRWGESPTVRVSGRRSAG